MLPILISIMGNIGGAMKLWRWKAEASNYAYGLFEYFIFKKNALRWLNRRDIYSHDVLSLTDRWTGKIIYLKDRLYGRGSTPKADILMSMKTGEVTIVYKDDKNGED